MAEDEAFKAVTAVGLSVDHFHNLIVVLMPLAVAYVEDGGQRQ
jgi:hypothetical protein